MPRMSQTSRPKNVTKNGKVLTMVRRKVDFFDDGFGQTGYRPESDHVRRKPDIYRSPVFGSVIL